MLNSYKNTFVFCVDLQIHASRVRAITLILSYMLISACDEEAGAVPSEQREGFTLHRCKNVLYSSRIQPR